MTEALYIEPYRTLFNGLEGVLNATPDWRRHLRQEAWAAFQARGIPTRHDEAWRWTNLRALQKGQFGLGARDPSAIPVDDLPISPLGGRRIVLVNGHLRTDLSELESLPRGLSIGCLGEAEGKSLSNLPLDTFPLAALNAALGQDGVAIEVEARIEEPLFLVNLTDGGVSQAQNHPQILLSLGEDAVLTLVSQDLGQGDSGYLNNTLQLIKLERGAALTHYALQEESNEATHITTRFADIGSGGRYQSYRLNLGAAASRDEYRITLVGDGARVTLNGGQLLRGRQLGDITTFVEHATPGTIAAETFKSVIDDRAQGVFQGKILVARDAQGSDGRMLNKTLLLSDKAEVDSKPELEIYADDVQCAHGATAGEIDAQALFYLRSRGLSEKTAQALLIRAFLAETLKEGLSVPEAFENAVLERIDRWIEETEHG